VSLGLVIQQAMHMCCIILSPVACLAVQYFSTFISYTAQFTEKSY